MTDPVTSAYWWQGVPNFGDRVSPLLLRRFANLDPYWAPAADAEMICVGSILEHMPPDWDGWVLGAGKLHPNSQPGLLQRTNPKVLALRGPMSAAGFHGDFALGDPGLLADELVDVETKVYDLGIVPHWSDKTLAHHPLFQRYHPTIIDPRGHPLDVIHAIGQCRKIVTSSLHGLIVADAFGIPRRFEYTPRFDKEGGMFKFQDYSAAIGTPMKIGETTLPSRYYIDDRKHELDDAFRALSANVCAYAPGG